MTTILEAIKDQELGFRSFLGDENGNLSSWKNWGIALSVLYGLRLPRNRRVGKLVHDCMGRSVEMLPKEGFDSALFLTGRRSGKSRIAAVVGAYEAILAGHEKKLAKGETGIVLITSPTRRQSGFVRKYLRAVFDESPMLQSQLASEDQNRISLKNGIDIEIMAADYRSVRGATVVAAIIDEVCFMGLEAESRVKNDTELVAAIEPALATTSGKLIGISSPYARRGWAYETYKRCFENDLADTMVWNCASRVMNPTMSQAFVEKKLAEDFAKNRSEYLGLWRDDVGIFIPRELLEQYVVKDRDHLLPRPTIRYFAFVDVSGGMSDDAAIAIAHRTDEGNIVIDSLKWFRPPFSPQTVIHQMAEHARRYGIRKVVGDFYAADFQAQAWKQAGMGYEKTTKNKSDLYLNFLGRLTSGAVQLPDCERLIQQLSTLERRTRSGGKDSIDHAPGNHDDLANVVAGVVELAANKRLFKVGAL